MSDASDTCLYIVIPVYGNWGDTIECLCALAGQSSKDFRVLVADDGSKSPPPVELDSLRFAEYIRYEHRGFAANCNRAANLAIERGATHLLFLNNDTVVTGTFVEQWLLTLKNLPDAILSPLVYWFSRPSKIWFSGGKLSIWLPFFRLRRDYRRPTEVDIVCGCAFVVPACRWRELGGFDEKYVTYYEDFDLTLRAKSKAIRTYVVPAPELRVLHKVSGSFRGAAWVRQYRMLTSSLIFIRSHYRGVRRWLCLGLQCVQIAAIVVMNFPELPQPSLFWKAVLKGFSE